MKVFVEQLSEDVIPSFSGMGLLQRVLAGLKVFFKWLMLLPLFLLLKVLVSAFRLVSACCSLCFVGVTFGVNSSFRMLFKDRMAILMMDLVSWVLLPFDFCSVLFRLFCRCIMSKTTI